MYIYIYTHIYVYVGTRERRERKRERERERERERASKRVLTCKYTANDLKCDRKKSTQVMLVISAARPY